MNEWPRIESVLSEYSAAELMDLLKDLYHADPKTALFLETRVLKSDNALGVYKEKIKEALRADPADEEASAWNAIGDYRSASGHDEGTAELMVAYVEVGNQFTLDYGDIDEHYYFAMEKAFAKAIDHLLAMKRRRKDIDPYKDRLRRVVVSTKGIGWGYHDALADFFYEAFGESESGTK